MPATVVEKYIEIFAEACIKMPEIRKKAKSFGINPSGMKKTDLIHAIQTAEFCTPCYGTSNGLCEELECTFRYDCLKNDS